MPVRDFASMGQLASTLAGLGGLKEQARRTAEMDSAKRAYHTSRARESGLSADILQARADLLPGAAQALQQYGGDPLLASFALGGGNAQQLAAAGGELREQRIGDEAIRSFDRGDMAGANFRALQSGGSAYQPFSVNSGGLVLNKASGELDESGMTAVANLGSIAAQEAQRRAGAAANMARATASHASADASRARADHSRASAQATRNTMPAPGTIDSGLRALTAQGLGLIAQQYGGKYDSATNEFNIPPENAEAALATAAAYSQRQQQTPNVQPGVLVNEVMQGIASVPDTASIAEQLRADARTAPEFNDWIPFNEPDLGGIEQDALEMRRRMIQEQAFRDTVNTPAAPPPPPPEYPDARWDDDQGAYVVIRNGQAFRVEY